MDFDDNVFLFEKFSNYWRSCERLYFVPSMTEVFQNIKALLDSEGIHYEHIEHEATPTSEDSARVRGDDLKQGAKAIVYKIQDQFALFVMAADQRMNPKKIKEYFKSKGKKAKKTRFASSDELMELTGLIPGSVPPFGQPILTFELFVDPSLMENEIISFNAGSITNSIRMSSKDYVTVAKPEVFDFCS